MASRRRAQQAAGTLTRPAPRFRLEHVQLARAEDLQRMARLGVVASVQPFHAVVDRYTAERYGATAPAAPTPTRRCASGYLPRARLGYAGGYL